MPEWSADSLPLPADEIISGERLQALTDVAIITPSKRAFHRTLPSMRVAEFSEDLLPEAPALSALAGARTIFVYSDMIDAFFKRIVPALRDPVAIMSHNSDKNITPEYRPVLDNPKIVHWFAQNALFTHPKLTPIPIGIANSQWPHGNVSVVAKAARLSSRTKKKSGLYVNFNAQTNPALREPVLAALRDKPYAIMGRRPTRQGPISSLISKLSRRPPPPADRAIAFREYLVQLGSYRFCVSPPGNGLDCHRTWEALYLGVIPVLTVPMHGLLDGLPHLVIENMADITLDDLEKRASEMRGPFTFEKLSMRYWRQRIGDVVQATASAVK